MRVIQTADLTPDSLRTETEKLHVYNGLDCCVTLEVFNEIEPHLDELTSATYAFSRALQAPVLEMNMRGILVDQVSRAEVLHSYRKDLLQLEAQFNRIILEVFDRHINWRSNKDLMEIFYTTMQIPPVRKRNPKGQYIPTVDRSALEKLDAYFYARPLISHLLLMRDIGKKVGVLETDIDADGRMRTSYNIAGTVTGRFSSSLSEFGSGCVPGDAEVLTKRGWVAIETALTDEPIAQFSEGLIEFVPWTKYETEAPELLICETEQIKLALTPGHRVLHWDYNNKTPRVESAAHVAQRHQVYLPLSGIGEGGTLTYPPYLAMLMADFTKEGTGWRGEFKKTRKIERFLELAELYGFKFTEQKARDGYRRFYIPGHLEWPKTWGEWVLKLDYEAALNLVEEARYWDSHSRGSSFIFYTADRTQAEWFATLVHLVGKSSTTRLMQQSAESYSTTPIYSVNIKPRSAAQVMRKHWKRVRHNGKVYCPRVESTFWLMRYKGSISVTGNTNLQNIEQRLRSVFVADPGYKLAYIDGEQAESRLVGAICWNLFDDSRYLDACESGDLHTTVTKMAWKDLPWVDDLKACKAIAEQPAYRQLSYRDLAKKLGHGSNYYGKPPMMAKQTKLDISVAKEFQLKYFTAFPGIKRWHEHTAETLTRTGEIVSLMNRKRIFLGRLNDDATLREAIAYNPQSSLSDIINTGLLNVWRAGFCQPLLQVHDAIVVQYPEDREEEIIPQLVSSFTVPIELNHGRILRIPSEVKVGWNWASVEFGADGSITGNPDGLVKYNPSKGDKRKRSRHPSSSLLDRRIY